jgi:hypothetical protein
MDRERILREVRPGGRYRHHLPSKRKLSAGCLRARPDHQVPEGDGANAQPDHLSISQGRELGTLSAPRNWSMWMGAEAL